MDLGERGGGERDWKRGNQGLDVIYDRKKFLKILFSKFLDFNTFRSDSILSNKLSNKILIVTGKLSQ